MDSRAHIVKSDVVVPCGSILLSLKWKNSLLAKKLKEKLQIIFNADLGVVDIHPSRNTAIIYVSEADIVTDTSYRKKIVSFRKKDAMKGFVIVEKTAASNQYFPPLQKLVCLQLGMVIQPVDDEAAAASYIYHLSGLYSGTCPDILQAGRSDKVSTLSVDGKLLQSVKLLPGLQNVKAKQLLKKFSCLSEIARANEVELAHVVGVGTARTLRKFLHEEEN